MLEMLAAGLLSLPVAVIDPEMFDTDGTRLRDPLPTFNKVENESVNAPTAFPEVVEPKEFPYCEKEVENSVWFCGAWKGCCC